LLNEEAARAPQQPAVPLVRCEGWRAAETRVGLPPMTAKALRWRI